jgi:UDP-GlcNAc:undecaprenyl-phosphate GlcNAc-1-phosphate transferase
MFKILLLVFFFNLFLMIFSNRISKIYNLFDKPDFVRKIHKLPVPLLGGLFLILNLLLIIFINKYIFLVFTNNYFSEYELLVFLCLCLFFYLLGFYDDKRNLSANYKLLMMAIAILLLIFTDKDLLIENLIFSFSENNFNLGIFSYFVTLLCFLLFINAFNMLDGINGQSASYLIFIFLILILKNVLVLFSTLMIINLFFFLILNFKNKAYLGDSGTLLAGYLISYIFVKNYNININKDFFVDEIFLIMSIPGYELLRLAIKRILEKKHPFKGDQSHIHHLLCNKFDVKIAYFTVQLLLIFPYGIYFFSKSFYISVLSSIFLYSLIIYKLPSSNK